MSGVEELYDAALLALTDDVSEEAGSITKGELFLLFLWKTDVKAMLKVLRNKVPEFTEKYDRQVRAIDALERTLFARLTND